MAGTFTIMEDGFITEPYRRQYLWQPIEGQNTMRNINGNKVGLVVTLSAEGKPDKTFYHEIENISFDVMTYGKSQEGFPDQETRDHWLQKLADEYSNS